MSNKKERSLTENLSIGLLCLAVGGILLHYGQSFLGWLMLSVGAFGITTSIFQNRLGHDKASKVGMIPTILTVVSGLYLNYIYKRELNSISVTIWMLIAIFGYSIFFNIFSFIKSRNIRIVLKSLGLIMLSVGLGALYYFYTNNLLLLNAFILFFATVYFRQGVGELLAGSSAGDPKVFLLSDFLVLVTLVGCFIYFRQTLFLHLGIITLVFSLFRFSTEQFIYEIAFREKQKLDPEFSRDEHRFSPSIFKTLTATHSGINILILPLFLIFIGLSLDQHIGTLEIQSDVFQASIGLLGIIAGFSTLILGERIRKNETGWKKQTYLLNGLVGITLLFFVIAILSFVGLTLNPLVQQASMPSSAEIFMGIIENNQIQIRLLESLINEFVFFAIPASLFYFFALSRDLIERFEQKNSEEEKIS